MQRRLGTIDLDTGEVLEEGIPVWIGRKPKITDRWFMAFQEAIEQLAKDCDLTGEHYRVLFYLLSRLDFDNYIQITQIDIAEALNMQKTHVSRAIKLLEQKNIILRGPKVGRSNTFRLSTTLGWKGNVKSLREAQKRSLEVIK